MLKKIFQRFGALAISSQIQDGRSRRFVAVIDCILNQNSRDNGAARFPAMNFRLLQLCQENGVGVLQMPCPEIAALGFRRMRPAGQSIRDAFDNERGRLCCARLAIDVADRIDACLSDGCKLLAVLGGNSRSPGCAVIVGENGLCNDSGLLMIALQDELAKRKLAPVFRGIRDDDPELMEQDLLWFQKVIERSSREA